MISKPMRPFYNTGPDGAALSVRHTTSTNPLGAMQTYNVGAPIFDQVDFKVQVNVPNITIQQAKDNRKYLQDLIDQLPDSGGVMRFNGFLQFYGGPIYFPQRKFAPQDGPKDQTRIIPFWIIGATPDATLANMDASDAIYFSTNGQPPFQVPSGIASCGCEGFQLRSGGRGLVVEGGGMMFVARNLTAFGCQDTAFDISNFDAGLLENLTAIGNWKTGIRLRNCHQTRFSAKSRYNLGDGLVIDGGGSLDGWIDAEGNIGYGINANGVKLSRIAGWQEANADSRDSRGVVSGQNTVQGKLRNCQIDFVGNFGQDNNNAFDMDGYSRLACTMAGRVPDESLLPYRLDRPYPGAHIINPRCVASPVTFVPAVAGGGVIVFRVNAGAISAQNADVNSNWIDLDGWNWVPSMKDRQINAGDVIEVRMKWQADADCVKFNKTIKAVPTIKVLLQHGGADLGSQEFYLHDTNVCELRITAQAQVSKVGTMAVRTLFYPSKLPGALPATSHTITLHDYTIDHVPA